MFSVWMFDPFLVLLTESVMQWNFVLLCNWEWVLGIGGFESNILTVSPLQRFCSLCSVLIFVAVFIVLCESQFIFCFLFCGLIFGPLSSPPAVFESCFGHFDNLHQQ